MERKIAWHEYEQKDIEALELLCQEYIQFLNDGKTERECVVQAVQQAKQAGYSDLDSYIQSGKSLQPGDKVYKVHMGKSIALFNIGTDDIQKGMNLLGAHIDSPRIDIKQNPLYEDSNLAFFDTHYYGGIKKYQWVAMPLALHGVIVKKDGTTIHITIGEKDSEPVFCITDLLPHLGQEQMEKKASKVIEGEALDVLIGSQPVKGELKEGVTKFLNDIFSKEYGFEEEDLLSAELEIVPAGKARELGFDRSMVIGYGQDDRVCAFTSLVAMLEVDQVKRTTCCLLVDKEEIGSVGATGMQSKFFENAVAEVLELMGETGTLAIRRTLENSRMLSSDVSAGYDPLYASAFEKKNASFLGKGVVFNKFTGSRGKSGSNDANAEYMGFIRRIMDDNQVAFQTAELGRVDLGGGGTIAYIMALYGMNVIDCGVAVLSMHAPWEITSKADIYEAKKCYIAFLTAAAEGLTN
ncbi:aminopeptidase [Veillonella montpellierensis]|uniref:aminopeptidase n=1 Tax=Veillonella montpellierensis TaxID=187328 RepID=UPI0023F69977|nr:aminopeptidase [Veillonella montpellierensis]